VAFFNGLITVKTAESQFMGMARLIDHGSTLDTKAPIHFGFLLLRV
jgi:hypothetical protein